MKIKKSNNNNYLIKTNRAFTAWRNWAWIFTLVVAFGGLYEPKLGLLVILVILGLLMTSFFTGRFWCGNVCAHGSLYDKVLLKFSLNKKIPKFFRSKIVMVLFFLWFGAKITFKIIKIFSTFSGMMFWDKLGFVFVSSYIMVLIIGVPIGLIFSPRAWCRFCPMGTMQRLSYKLGKVLKIAKKTDRKISIDSKHLCHGCGKCSRVCPMQLTPHLEFDDQNQFSSDKCIKCKTCVENCPAKILSLSSTEKAIKKTMEIEKEIKTERRSFEAETKEINMLADDVMEVIIDLKKDKMNYRAGQFVLIHLNDENKTKRAYTVSGYDKEQNLLRITIKKVEKGYGTEIIYNTFKVGKKVTVEGPMGEELIVDKKHSKIILIAAGIGITPFVPIIKELSEANYSGEVVLLYGARYEKELFYSSDIQEYIKDHNNMRFIPVLSRDKNFKGRKGYVTDVLKDLDIDKTKIYMCAAKGVAESTRKQLEERNFDLNEFYVETA
jgi:NAD(P)H-flavin reductase/NAD-dependent dihydropyrimidine dehydrogenase PreA subunit